MTATSVLEVLIPIAMLAVLVALGMGVYSLYRGGDFSRSFSNKFMRLRVVLQLVAVVLIMSALYLSGS
jgi:hypothetical protein